MQEASGVVSPSLRVKSPSRRGEGGGVGKGGPLWSPAVPLNDGIQLNHILPFVDVSSTA